MLILAAAVTGLRQSELLGIRWRDIDVTAQRVRVRNAFVRGEHSSEGKSDLSTRRSVPMADWLASELAAWRARTAFDDDDDLVFAHPQLGKPLDPSKVTRRFKAACRDAGVREIRFHDLRHTFATSLAASARRCGRSRSSSDTRTSRRRRSTRTTRRPRGRSTWSTPHSLLAASDASNAVLTGVA